MPRPFASCRGNGVVTFPQTPTTFHYFAQRSQSYGDCDQSYSFWFNEYTDGTSAHDDKAERMKFNVFGLGRVASDAASAVVVLLPVLRVQLVDTYLLSAGWCVNEASVANIDADMRRLFPLLIEEYQVTGAQ